MAVANVVNLYTTDAVPVPGLVIGRRYSLACLVNPDGSTTMSCVEMVTDGQASIDATGQMVTTVLSDLIATKIDEIVSGSPYQSISTDRLAADFRLLLAAFVDLTGSIPSGLEDPYLASLQGA